MAPSNCSGYGNSGCNDQRSATGSEHQDAFGLLHPLGCSLEAVSQSRKNSFNSGMTQYTRRGDNAEHAE